MIKELRVLDAEERGKMRIGIGFRTRLYRICVNQKNLCSKVSFDKFLTIFWAELLVFCVDLDGTAGFVDG